MTGQRPARGGWETARGGRETGRAGRGTARDEMLRRIRVALADRPAPVDVAREYRTAGERRVDDVLGLFAERVADYRASVHRCMVTEIDSAIRHVLDRRGRHRIAVPHDLPPQWIAPEVHAVVVPGSGRPDPRMLDTLDGVLTGCACAIALTGTIVLDGGPGQGWRALTLVPDYHLVVVRADQIVPGVPDAVARLDATRAMTWISGPSATSDIELDRVEGVHGPRTLDVVIIDHPST